MEISVSSRPCARPHIQQVLVQELDTTQQPWGDSSESTTGHGAQLHSAPQADMTTGQRGRLRKLLRDFFVNH